MESLPRIPAYSPRNIYDLKAVPVSSEDDGKTGAAAFF